MLIMVRTDLTLGRRDRYAFGQQRTLPQGCANLPLSYNINCIVFYCDEKCDSVLTTKRFVNKDIENTMYNYFVFIDLNYQKQKKKIPTLLSKRDGFRTGPMYGRCKSRTRVTYVKNYVRKY